MDLFMTYSFIYDLQSLQKFFILGFTLNARFVLRAKLKTIRVQKRTGALVLVKHILQFWYAAYAACGSNKTGEKRVGFHDAHKAVVDHFRTCLSFIKGLAAKQLAGRQDTVFKKVILSTILEKQQQQSERF